MSESVNFNIIILEIKYSNNLIKMIHCLLLINRQGKVRLMKWYDTFLLTDRVKYIREVILNKIDSSNCHRPI
jgi:hypothetical protein